MSIPKETQAIPWSSSNTSAWNFITKCYVWTRLMFKLDKAKSRGPCFTEENSYVKRPFFKGRGASKAGRIFLTSQWVTLNESRDEIIWGVLHNTDNLNMATSLHNAHLTEREGRIPEPILASDFTGQQWISFTSQNQKARPGALCPQRAPLKHRLCSQQRQPGRRQGDCWGL